MDITVSSRNVEVSPALKQVTVEKIGRLGRFLDGMDRAEVHFFEEKNPRIEAREVCEVTLQGHGHYVRTKVAAVDLFAAVDLAVEKLEHQLHKLKTRLVNRHNGKGHTAGGRTPAPTEAHEVETPVGPRVVKSKRFRMKPMSVDEAILQMELLGHEFFFFEEAESGEPSVVYRRADGDVGLIQPQR